MAITAILCEGNSQGNLSLANHFVLHFDHPDVGVVSEGKPEQGSFFLVQVLSPRLRSSRDGNHELGQTVCKVTSLGWFGPAAEYIRRLNPLRFAG